MAHRYIQNNVGQKPPQLYIYILYIYIYVYVYIYIYYSQNQSRQRTERHCTKTVAESSTVLVEPLLLCVEYNPTCMSSNKQLSFCKHPMQLPHTFPMSFMSIRQRRVWLTKLVQVRNVAFGHDVSMGDINFLISRVY